MHRSNVSRHRLFLCLLAIASPLCLAQARPADPSDLKNSIQQADARLFGAYNTCDLDTLAAMVADDLEFFHDQSGLTTGKAPFLAAMRANVCGKVHRELLPQTLEVYPLNHYGAVEIGIHRFSHPGQSAEGPGDARFVHVWQRRGEAWVLTRVISFEHNRGLLVNMPGKQ